MMNCCSFLSYLVVLQLTWQRVGRFFGCSFLSYLVVLQYIFSFI